MNVNRPISPSGEELAAAQRGAAQVAVAARAAGGAPGRRQLLGGAAAGLLGVAALAGWTGLRGVLHALLLALAAAALMPLVLLLAALALLGAAGVVVGLVAQDDLGAAAAGEGVVGGGGRLARAYYRLAWRQRQRPFVWGLAAGLGLGLVGAWCALAVAVLPGESATLDTLLHAGARLDALPQQPQAPSDGLLRPRLWGAAGAADAPVLDGFGRPVRYSRRGAWRATSYTLRSLGYDGVPSADDLCVSGHTALGGLLERARDPLRFLDELSSGELGWSERAEALANTACEPPAEEDGAGA